MTRVYYKKLIELNSDYEDYKELKRAYGGSLPKPTQDVEEQIEIAKIIINSMTDLTEVEKFNLFNLVADLWRLEANNKENQIIKRSKLNKEQLRN